MKHKHTPIPNRFHDVHSACECNFNVLYAQTRARRGKINKTKLKIRASAHKDILLRSYKQLLHKSNHSEQQHLTLVLI